MKSDFLAKDVDQFVDFVLDELGRWAAEDCPILFKSRPFKTEIFDDVFTDNEEDSTSAVSPIQLKFAKNGYIIIKISPDGSYDDIRLARFSIANPSMKDNLLSCVRNLTNKNFSDFLSLKEAQVAWRSQM